MVIIDDERFNVDVANVERTADFLDKHAKRTENGDLKRELIGVYYNYTIEFAPGAERAEYARLWDKLTEPEEFHTVTVPGTDGDYTFKAYFSGISDKLLRQYKGNYYWTGLKAKFIAKAPARM